MVGPSPAARGLDGGNQPDPRQLLARALEALCSEGLEGRSPEALTEDVRLLRRGVDVLEGDCGRRLRQLDSVRDPADRQARPLPLLLQQSCGLSGAAAAERVEVARRLPELPLTQRAFDSGTICYEQARVLARAARDIGAEAVRAAEPELIELARTADAGVLQLAARELRHRVDPAGGLRAANVLHERRQLHLGRGPTGGVTVDGFLDPEGGARLTAALDALMMPVAGDGRSAPQRRADALVELADRNLAHGDLPLVGGERPHLTVIVPAATLRGEAGGEAADLSWAGPIAAETAQRLACDSAATVVTVDGTGTPLDVGRTRRTVPPWLRRALVVRDRHCRFPHCDRPPSWSDCHHLQPWSEDGETSLANLVLLCRAHHRSVHEGGWRLAWQGSEIVGQPP